MNIKALIPMANHLLIIALFCTATFVPLVTGIIEKDKTVSKIEKRKLARLPKTPQTMVELEKYPDLFAKYYSDHFGLREWFTKYSKILKFYLGDSPAKNATIGKDGWLFLGSIKYGYKKPSGDPMGDARNANLYTEKQLKQFTAHLTTLKSQINERGMKYLLVIAPNKHSIYFEHLPDYIEKVNPESALDQLVNYLAKHSKVNVVDLRPHLLKEKPNQELYYKLDSHWNTKGANIAQYAIMKKIELLFPGKIQPELFKFVDRTRKGGDLSNLMGVHLFTDYLPLPVLSHLCKPERQPKNTRETKPHTFSCPDGQLNAVIFRDSFFNYLQPFFARKFKRSTYLWEHLNYPSLIKAVEAEHPDIIIEELVERKLPYFRK